MPSSPHGGQYGRRPGPAPTAEYSDAARTRGRWRAPAGWSPGRLGQPEVAHLASPTSSPTAPATSSIGTRRIHPVLVEQVHVVGAQPLQRDCRSTCGLLRRLFSPPGALLVQVPADVATTASSDARPVPAEQFLVGPRPVHLGGVEEAAASSSARCTGGDRLGVVGRPRTTGSSHATQTERRHGQPLTPQYAYLHDPKPPAGVHSKSSSQGSVRSGWWWPARGLPNRARPPSWMLVVASGAAALTG